MDMITVDKGQLIDTLRSNRSSHQTLYERALKKYETKAQEWFQEQLAKIVSGSTDWQRICPLPVPECHTDDFDRAIEMLEWHKGDTVELSEHDFRQYVQNKWGWHASFTSNTASYVQS